MCPGMTSATFTCGACTRRSVISASEKPFTANLAAQYGVCGTVGPRLAQKPLMLEVLNQAGLVARHQQGNEGPGAVVHAIPADAENPLPLLPVTVDECDGAADTGIVEQQVDALCFVLLHHRIAECEHLGLVCDIALVRGDPHGIAAHRGRLVEAVRENVAGRHIATRRRELNREFAPDSASATR